MAFRAKRRSDVCRHAIFNRKSTILQYHPARSVCSSLRVLAVPDHSQYHLGVSLRLHPSAHDAKSGQRRAGSRQKARDNRAQRPLT
jgi:hypothetical protein